MRKNRDSPLTANSPEVLDAIKIISRKLGRNLKFGYYTEEDICQEAWIWAHKCMPYYDPHYKLFNFLFTQVKNKLLNLRRDKLERINVPCHDCPLGVYCSRDEICTKYADINECSYWYEWRTRNDRKKALANPAIGGVSSGASDNASQFIPERTEQWEVFVKQFSIDLQIELQLYRKYHNFTKKRFNRMVKNIKEELDAKSET